MKTITIAGGTGFLGKEITKQLLSSGYKVQHLSTRKNLKNSNIPTFYWNPESGEIDKDALVNCEGIIIVSGLSIQVPWTKENKKKIFDSRIKGIQLIYSTLAEINHNVKVIVGTSGINYFPSSGNKELKEEDAPGTDFISGLCVQIEAYLNQFQNQLGIRTVITRPGVILSKKGGALPFMIKPIKLGVGAILGDGNQFFPWVDLVDAASFYLFALEQEAAMGPYNLVAPEMITHKDFQKQLAQNLNRKIILPNLPSFLVKLIFGEKSVLLLGSIKASSKRLEEQGFRFSHPTVKESLNSL